MYYLNNSMINNICNECNIFFGKKNFFFQNYLCYNCFKLDKYKLFNKNYCKKKYYLDDKDLNDLKEYTYKLYNKIYSYYSKQDIINKCCTKYSIDPSELDNYLFNKYNIKQELYEYNKYQRLIRQNELIKALKEKGLELRSDSVLCKKYINNNKNLKLTLNNVVDRMCQMKYLYEYCNMEKIKNSVYNEYIKLEHFPNRVSVEAEIRALDKYSNGKYPDSFPWLN